MINYNKNFQLWCTSHLSLDALREKYNFSENEHLKLYYLKDKHEGKNIDKYGFEFGGFAAMYYVWMNNLKSDIVGFCEYRRHFNPEMINLERINNGEVQTWECQIGYYHPKTDRYNNFFEWCLMFKFPTWVIYKFVESLSEFLHKPLTEIVNDLCDKSKVTKLVGRQMYICKWETFNIIMTIYNNFLNKIIPGFNENIDNFENYWNIETALFNQKYQIGDLDTNDREQNFYWSNGDTVFYNRRIPAYYGETFLGTIIEYLFSTFEQPINYFVNIEGINNDNKQKVLDLYFKDATVNGVRDMRCYDPNIDQVDLSIWFDDIYNSEYYKLSGISKYWANEMMKKQEIKTDTYYEKNIFIDLYK